MVLGSAVLAAVAAGTHSSVVTGMAAMSSAQATVEPCAEPELRRYHDAKYAVYRRMQGDQKEYQALMQAAEVV